MAHEITLFDLPSKDPCRSWSLNPWKTRLLLNYKGVAYKTTWVEYPEIEPLFKSFGIPPHKADTEVAPYTIPAIRLADGRYIMGSDAIASEVGKLHPDPSLPLDAELQQKLRKMNLEVLMTTGGIFLPACSRNLIGPASLEWFDRNRGHKWYRKSLEQLEQDTDAEAVWNAASDGFRKMGDVLKVNSDGPFIMGEKVTYADFIIVGMLQFCRRVEEEFYQKAIAIEPSLGDLYEACKQWLQMDN